MNIFTANNTINKNLVKFAKSLNLEIWLHDGDDDEDDLFTVSELDENGEAECEWLFSYRVENGELFYAGNIYFPEEAKQELPAWIGSYAKLKEVIEFTASTMKAA